jgi:hypothetical protein
MSSERAERGNEESCAKVPRLASSRQAGSQLGRSQGGPVDAERIVVGEGVAAGMAQHVGVRLQFEASHSSGPLHHPGQAGRRERGPPLAAGGRQGVGQTFAFATTAREQRQGAGCS